MSEQDRAGSHPDSHPTLCSQKTAKAPRRASSRREADQQDAAVTLNRACCCTPLTRCRGQHSGGGAFCAGAETTTDTTRRAPAAVVGAGVLLVTSTYSASRLLPGPRGLRTRPIGPHGAPQKRAICCQRRTILRLTHEFETGETEVRISSGL
jgi:hypothetical protein